MANYEERTDRFTAIEERYSGFTVNDRNGSKIGKVDDLFVDENDEPEYIGVKMGFLGTRSTLIPMDAVTVDEAGGYMTVSSDKDTVKDGPAFDDDREITPEYEDEVRSYYGLGAVGAGAGATAGTTTERGGYGEYYSDDEEYSTTETTGTTTTGATSGGTAGPGMEMGDTESGRFESHDPAEEGPGRDDDRSDLEDEDELRVQRSEEELRAGTREREAGRMNVRKRVRTDRERIEVPTRHEEVSVERVPVEGRTPSEAEIGEDEVSVPVTEEEVVVDKQAVVKEEVRLRKDVVEDTETVEEDVRREEVEIDDETERGRGTGR